MADKKAAEIRAKIAKIKKKLDEHRQYQELMAAEGVDLDAEDHQRKTDLFNKLRTYEKQLRDLGKK
jgi:hypothetical protein